MNRISFAIMPICQLAPVLCALVMYYICFKVSQWLPSREFLMLGVGKANSQLL